MSLRCLTSSLGSICITVWEMLFEEFPDGPRGSHLGRPNGMNLAALNRHVSPMPLIKFQLNPTYRSKADVVSRYWNGMNLAILNLHVDPMPPTMFWLNQTTALEQTWFEDFQAGHRGGHLGYRNGTILAILNILFRCLPSSFSSI